MQKWEIKFFQSITKGVIPIYPCSVVECAPSDKVYKYQLPLVSARWLTASGSSLAGTDTRLMTDTAEQQDAIIIQGITKDGRKFRPSDWAERMSGMMSTFGKDHRIHYSPLLKPVDFKGAKSVVIDKSLAESNPAVYNQLIDFARRNNLVVMDGKGNEVDLG